jgi:hypothetical protein
MRQVVNEVCDPRVHPSARKRWWNAKADIEADEGATDEQR